MVPMNTCLRWSMLAPTWNYMTPSVPPLRANRPVRMFIPLNWAWLRDPVDLVDELGDLDLDLHPVFGSVHAVCACTASSRIRWMMSCVSPK